MRIPLDAPNIGELEKEYVMRAFESGYVSSAGPMVAEFEERFAVYVGARFAVAIVNGTSAIHLALRLLDIGPGDEVIVPALTFIATVNPVLYVGATPVIVDVDPATWNIDVDKMKKALTARTRAIIPVHLYGNPADMTSLMKVAFNHNLRVVEDATEALGATCKGKSAGTIADMGVFSFNGNKVITTGGGGMLVTNNSDLANRARLLVNQGREAGIFEYEHQEIGYNFRLNNLQAALGLAQLERLPEFLKNKRRYAALYREMFKDVTGLSWQKELGEAKSNWWLFSLLMDREHFGENRAEVARRLLARGIQVRPLFTPLSRQPAFASAGFAKCPVAENLHERGLNLPGASFLTEEDIYEVGRAILGG
ncbi:LegC family aminotransferase [Pelotomaculum terephthalicicum JT]|uniref:LegC family aminotransferase n=1 Tax=Pelotomaculum TaxID=191373 RepID=UPI0009C6EDB2|nr:MULTISPECIES: LegC family aminotransferase [Pelotomaculum]MCG9967991.1 LegC family aminotransferase [Pelotomaculum terephthalicicum JT]OPX88591.1 MAG: putative pyridoxal phosphate-dependent aminotransferase EpsN [Pelotomaculum sp. PtaB.Bin117]OPY63036.1 MAG: putative pyridoxal phosphate-dependent aminotransferase EpsN [Pelotomaculum sp. PtaU1.Bin065]